MSVTLTGLPVFGFANVAAGFEVEVEPGRATTIPGFDLATSDEVGASVLAGGDHFSLDPADRGLALIALERMDRAARFVDSGRLLAAPLHAAAPGGFRAADSSKTGGASLSVRKPTHETPPDYEIGQGGSLSWTKPWRIPDSVEGAISAVFAKEEGTLTDRLKEATNILLTWRVRQIPDPGTREAALKALAQSFEYGQWDGRRFRSMEDVDAACEELMEIFPERIRGQVERTLSGWAQAVRRTSRDKTEPLPLRELIKRLNEFSMLRRAVFGWLGAVNAGFEAWIHPELREPDLELMLHVVQVHEIGGHLVAGQGGDGFLQPWLHRIGLNRFIKFLDPLEPLNTRWMTWVSESYATGAEWELLNRIPAQAREMLASRLNAAAGEHGDLFQIPSHLEFRRELKRRFGQAGVVDRVYYASLHAAYRKLAAIARARSKSEYVRLTRPWDSYDFLGLLWLPTRSEFQFLRHEGVVWTFYGRQVVYAAKLAAYAGALYALFG